MKNATLLFIIFATIISVPVPVFSAIPKPAFSAVCPDGGAPQNFSELVCLFVNLISTAIPVVAGIAVLVFFWGLAKFVLKAGSENDREEGKQIMLWGIIALFVLVSLSGIIVFIHAEIFNESPIFLPTLPENSP